MPRKTKENYVRKTSSQKKKEKMETFGKYSQKHIRITQSLIEKKKEKLYTQGLGGE